MFRRMVLIGISAAVILSAAVFLAVPGLRTRVSERVTQWVGQVRYELFPPEEALFVPQADIDRRVQATLHALAGTPPAGSLNEGQVSAAPLVTPSPPALPTSTGQPELPTAAPTAVPTPLPARVKLDGVRYMDQHGLWNYCAPSTLAMALSYWGWQGDRLDTGQTLKPFEKDKNVMLYEMVDYVLTSTNLTAVSRPAGTDQLLKRMIAAGYPVLIEKGPFTRDVYGKITWMGHYTVVTGYDDAAEEWITQDALIGPDFAVSYEQLVDEWRAFNYQFMVIFPPDRQADVMSLLGELADPVAADRLAAEHAAGETAATGGLDLFFAWYNRGSSLVSLGDYPSASAAYDQAFSLMAGLKSDQRPWRMIWYQTGPYFAYYHSGRYQDVIDLADNTLNNINEPYLEESFVWRARARIALNQPGADDDVAKALEYHPGFQPALDLAAQFGMTP